MIVSIGSIRGAPGVTSWAVALAAAWPDTSDGRVVLEADLDGGVLGARYGVGVDPGVVSLIAALRRNGDKDLPLDDHARTVGANVLLVPGPETGEQARRVWSSTAADVAPRLADDRRTWIVDVGRTRAGNATDPIVNQSSFTLLLSRGYAEDLVQIPSRLDALPPSAQAMGVMVVGATPYTKHDLADFFGVDHVWRVNDSDDLPQLTAAVLKPGRARRSWLWRSALELAADIASISQATAQTTGTDEQRSLEDR